MNNTIQHMQEMQDFPLESISVRVKQLNETFGRLFRTIDQQIDAIVVSDVDRIEQLTDEHTSLHTEFKERERAFVEALREFVPAGLQQEHGLSLSRLKELYPEYASFLEDWQELLSRNMKWLQRHQTQLVQLLEFAQRHNTTIMRTMYSIENEKSVHYNVSGRKTAFSSAVSINQEA